MADNNRKQHGGFIDFMLKKSEETESDPEPHKGHEESPEEIEALTKSIQEKLQRRG